MLEEIAVAIRWFINKFWAKPSGDSGASFTMEEIIRCESTHFLFSCFSGWLVFSLTLTILSSEKCSVSDHYIWSISLVSGLLASVTIHIVIDAFTTLA